MILSASGWRCVFADSGDEEDATPLIDSAHITISQAIAAVYADYMTTAQAKKIVVGIDARPTGPLIAREIIKVLLTKGFEVEFPGIIAAPEIMAYSHKVDGFIYISASHNPIGHNGIKFGKNDGGVIPGSEAAILADAFRAFCKNEDAPQKAAALAEACPKEAYESVLQNASAVKEKTLATYRAFTQEVISGTACEEKQKKLFDEIRDSIKKTPLSIVCDMNGSARTVSIDKSFFAESGIGFFALSNEAGHITHAIIPEPENLVHCAREMEGLQAGQGKTAAGKHPECILGYMPDCDGDRGNIVFWNDRTNKAEVLKAQEVFAVSVMSELAYLAYTGKTGTDSKIAVAVNDPTSMRIEEIADAFGALVGRAEVGEANVVNKARELRAQGYEVRILGEGSNGGNITHPAAVRDPLNSLFALIKLLVIKDSVLADGTIKKGLFHEWCSRSGHENDYKDNFTLADVMATLPEYTTTGVSEKRAVLKIKTKDHSILKKAYQEVFEKEWSEKKEELKEKYGIYSYTAISNNGTKETVDIKDYSVSKKGGLKILFKNESGKPISYIWMRGSGTEPVFRVLCDVKGNNPKTEAELLEWHSKMIAQADS
ncbi:MAG: phosphoglucomutase [Treponemataceae bacterium]|nr:phosphoglucomutase [Treponemataceae bacterium]